MGQLPLLTILIDFSDKQFPPDQPPSYYENLLFGTEKGVQAGSIAGTGGFFQENSFGQFRFTNAGVIGPFHALDDASTPQREDTIACGALTDTTFDSANTKVECAGRNRTMRNAMIQAAANGFNYFQYDANHDGRIDKNELLIVFIFATGEDGGTNRTTYPESPCVSVVPGFLEVCHGPGYTSASGYRIGDGWPSFGSDVDVATVAHELSHAIGVWWEAYGHWSKLGSPDNFRYSLMASTITPTFRDQTSLHLDPFAKIKLGWIRPKVVPVTLSTNSCLLLTATESISAPPDTRAVILYDPARGVHEFFILEYRRPLLTNYDGGIFGGPVWADPTFGLTVWAVRTKIDAELDTVPSMDGKTGGSAPNQDPSCAAGLRCNDSALHIYPPPRGLPRVGNPLPFQGRWIPADGQVSVTFPYSQVPSPISLRVRGTLNNGSQLAVELNQGSCTPLLTLDPSYFQVPPGFAAYDRFLTTSGPSLHDVWTSSKFRIERVVPVYSRPGAPVQVHWSVTPLSQTDSAQVRVKIVDALPSALAGAGSYPADQLPPIIGQPVGPAVAFDLRLNDGQTRSASYTFTAGTREGAFRVPVYVYLLNPSTGALLEQPLSMESFINIANPDAPPPGDQPAGVVDPPAPVTVRATEAGGARGSASAALASFLNGGSATFPGGLQPVRVSPQVGGADVSPATLFPIGTTVVTFRFVSSANVLATGTSTVTVMANKPPALQAPGPVTVSEGTFVTLAATASDPDGDPVTYSWDLNNDGTYESPGQPVVLPVPDGPASYVARVRACDSFGACATSATTVTVLNVAPAVSITAPASGLLFAAGAPIAFQGSFLDPGADSYTGQWQIGALTRAATISPAAGGGTAALSTTLAAGVYAVRLTVTDDDGGAGVADTAGGLPAYVVVYDPANDYAAGGGWFISPKGALVSNPSVTDRAVFGFVARGDARSPSGEAFFRLAAGALEFESTSLDEMRIAGPFAWIRGRGKVNAQPGFRYEMTALDGQRPGGGGSDRFRIRIVDGAGNAVYDNGLGSENPTDATPLNGGSIVIQR